jgi:hypothetical protein
MRINENQRNVNVRKRKYRPPLSERGLGPAGGGWNVKQAAAWSGLSEFSIRDLIKRKEAGEEVTVFPHFRAGRRIVIAREGFKVWFNALDRSSVA